MATKIMTCERCEETLIGHPESPRRPVPVTYGETDMTICYECAVDLTMLIGHWLAMEDPVVVLKKEKII